VQIYNAEIVLGGFTNWHYCHNGAAFFVALEGMFEAHFQEGVLVKAKVGRVLHVRGLRACDKFDRTARVT